MFSRFSSDSEAYMNKIITISKELIKLTLAYEYLLYSQNGAVGAYNYS